MSRVRLEIVLIIGLAIGVLILAACGSGPTEGQSPLATPPEEQVATPPNVPEGVKLSIADLAKRLGIDASQIEAVRIEPVDWPDTSLGCPQPGQAYAQVITPGYLVILTAGGQEYEYHTNLSQIVTCEP